MPERGRRPGLLVLDFDGTLVTRDVGDALVEAFAEGGAERLAALDRRAARGEITLVELQETIWPHVRCDEPALERWLAEEVALRPGAERLLEEAHARGWGLLVASGGFRIYIDRVLARLGPLAASVEVLANDARFEGGGIRIAFPFRDALPCARGCGLCKGALLDGRAEAADRIAFCGDGLSDLCAAARADALFCVRGSRLHAHAAREGLAHRAFDTFDEVRASLFG